MLEFHLFSGVKRRILVLFMRLSAENDDRTTGPVTMAQLVGEIAASRQTIKTTIGRLKKDGAIAALRFHPGRGGWVIYQVAEAVVGSYRKHVARLQSALANAGGTCPASLECPGSSGIVADRPALARRQSSRQQKILKASLVQSLIADGGFVTR